MATPTKKKAPAKAAKPVTKPAPAAKPAPGRPAPPPLTLGPPPQALALFERGMSALQRHAYDGAAEAFDALIAGYPTERTLLDRARVYRDLCARELRRQPAAPQTSEERLTLATLALNNGRDVEAENLAKRVLADDPKQDLAAYLLAAIEARRGHANRALEFLEQAIKINPGSRAQARHDEDFAALQDLDAFRSLTDAAARATTEPPKPVAKRGRTA